MNDSVEKTSDKKILIVSDSDEELENIHDLLVKDFNDLLETDVETEGLDLFGKYHPSLLILAFNTVEKAEHFYLSLYRNNKNIYETPHQTLLLCKNNESQKAYELCKTGTFDDYVADRPLYDPFRMRLCVVQALTRQTQDKYSYALGRQVNKISNELNKFDQNVTRKLASGDSHHNKTIQTFHQFTSKLETDLGRLEKKLVSHDAGNASGIFDRDNISNQFKEFRRASLEKQGQHVEDQLKETGSWMKDLGDSYHENIQNIQETHRNKSIHVLMIDDDDFYRALLTDMLQEQGIQIDGVGDGETALIALQNMHPDVILLDYTMPGLDGVETLKRIKSNSVTESIPVIMLTGAHDREIVNQCVHAGAIDYIVKPCHRSTILAKIDEVLNINT